MASRAYLLLPLLYLTVLLCRVRMAGATNENRSINTKHKSIMKIDTYTKVVDEVVQRMAQHADVVMNVEQVANYLGLSVGAVRKRAQFPSHRNSKHLYFSKMEIDSALLDQKLITAR